MLASGSGSHQRQEHAYRLTGIKPSFIDVAHTIPFPVRRLPSDRTKSGQVVEQIEQWIEACLHTNHQYCLKSKSTNAPRRILEVRHDRFYLREELDSIDKYACLSHCWGPTGLSFKLTRATEQSFKAGMMTSELPATFRDAMILCSKLGITYIWVDALCKARQSLVVAQLTNLGILQDDVADWKHAAATMADIYEGSYLTIAATGTENANGGLFRTVHSANAARMLKASALHVQEHRLPDFPREHNPSIALHSGCPLLSRGWVFQERHLSSRIIHFTKYQMVWECRSTLISESRDIVEDWTTDDYEPRDEAHDTGLQHYPFKYPRTDTNIAWQDAVAHYSRLSLTVERDRLPAIAALVQRRMRLHQNDTYIAGMWLSTFLRDAAWQCSSFEQPVARPNTSIPSWSWASSSGSIQFEQVTPLTSVRVVSHDARSIGPVHVGEVQDARVILRGYCLAASVKRIKSYACGNGVQIFYKIYPALETFEEGVSFTPDYDLITGANPISSTASVNILLLWSGAGTGAWRGLILRRVSGSDFERLGTCSFWYLPLGIDVTEEDKSQQFLSSLRMRDMAIV
jgi:hypothetical protein